MIITVLSGLKNLLNSGLVKIRGSLAIEFSGDGISRYECWNTGKLEQNPSWDHWK